MNTQKMIIREFGEALTHTFANKEELEHYLSERFEEEIETFEDAQVAFDELSRETKGLLARHCLYSLSEEGGVWSVETGVSFDDKQLSTYLTSFKDHYNQPFLTLDDMLSKLQHHVLKTTDNVGCDAHSALRMILEEDLLLEDIFTIQGADGPARILFEPILQ